MGRRSVYRAWIKGAVRRPVRAFVVVVTLVVMTVGVVGALAAADTLEQLFVADAEVMWGEVDVEVTSAEGATFDETAARRIGIDAGEHSNAWAPRVIVRAVVASGGHRDADTVVLGLGGEERAFETLRRVAGSAEVLRLKPEEVIVNERLARRVRLAVGDTLQMVIAVPTILEDEPGSDIPRRRPPEAVRFAPRIAGIVKNTGVADLGRTPNVLLRRDALQRVVDLRGQVTHLHMAAATDADDLIRAIDPALRIDDLDRAAVAEDALAIAEDEGGQFRSILLTLALLVAGAAMVGASQLLTSLAEDRSREIGVLRALGIHGRTIARLVTTESVVYAAVALAIGLVLALPVADLLATRLSDHFASLSAGRGREQVALSPVLSLPTVITGALLVALTAALAGRSAGHRLAELEPDALLRGPIVDLPEPPPSRRRAIVVAMLGSLALGAGLLGGPASDALRYIGITLLLTGWWLSRRATSDDRNRLDRRAAIVGLLWATVGAGALADFSQGYETGFAILVVAGIITVTAIGTLLAGRFRSVVGWIRAYAPRGRWQVSLRTAGAYADASRGRSGRLFATFGIVLFVAAALEVLGNATAIDTKRQAGGFDVLAQSAVGMDRLQLTTISGWGGGVALASSMIPEDRFGTAAPDGDDVNRVRYPVRLMAVTPQLVAEQRFGVAASGAAYNSAAEALEAAARDDNKAVVDRYARPPGAAIGDDVVLDLGAGPRRYELVGVLDTFLLGGVFVSPDEYADLVASTGSTLLLGRAGVGRTPQELASSVEAWGREYGVDAQTMDEVAHDVTSVNKTFTDTFALMLLLGLVVALVAVVAMLVRSARERRPYLGVLRAMGLRRGTVAATLAAEPVTVALTGAIAGLGGGLGSLRLLFALGFSDLAFVIHWTRMLTILGTLALFLVALCTVAAWPNAPRDVEGSLRSIA